VDAALVHAQNLLKNHNGSLPYNVDDKSAEGKLMKDDTQTLQQFNNHAQIPGSRCPKDKDSNNLSVTTNNLSAQSNVSSGGCNSTGDALGANAIALLMLALSFGIARRRHS
jgi:MYXO-CTERM domain-containing protein